MRANTRIAAGFFGVAFLVCLGGFSSSSMAFDVSRGPYGGEFEKICGRDNVPGNWTKIPNDKEIALIAKMMGSRSHRLWHTFWHRLRTDWDSEPLESRVVLERTAKIMAGLDPRTTPGIKDGAWKEDEKFTATGRNWKSNGERSGIDFFYMHHVMIVHLFKALREAHLRCIEPWGSSLGDGPDGKEGNPEGPKGQPGISELQGMAKDYMAESYLKGVPTLAAFGDTVEGRLHGGMHMRYGTPSQGYSNCRVSDALIGRSAEEIEKEIQEELKEEKRQGAQARPEADVRAARAESDQAAIKALKNWIDGQCEDAGNNSLYSTSTSHVHWVFYKLHGLVERLMFEWAQANGYDWVQLPDGSCPGAGKCYKFTGAGAEKNPPWQGGTPPPGMPGKQASMEGHAAHGGGIDLAFHQALDSVVREASDAEALKLGEARVAAMTPKDYKDPKIAPLMQVASQDPSAMRVVMSRIVKMKSNDKDIRRKSRLDSFMKYVRAIQNSVKSWEFREDLVSKRGSGH